MIALARGGWAVAAYFKVTYVSYAELNDQYCAGVRHQPFNLQTVASYNPTAVL